ncbi:extracellular solute-binding protein [Shouchella clausii]
MFGTTKYEELAEVYMEENPGVKINIQEGDNTDHHNNLFTALSTGSGAPDLALVEINEIERYRDAQGLAFYLSLHFFCCLLFLA